MAAGRRAAPAVALGAGLPERAAVAWRAPVDARALRLRERLWTLSTAAHSVPFVATAGILVGIEPGLAPVSALALVHAWAIPELYANRGAKVVRAPRRRDARRGADRARPARRPRRPRGARAARAHGAWCSSAGALGAWLVGEAGALLVRPGGRRVHCWCVRADDPSLPSADRTAHLLLALREDETGFATVANLAFSGAAWRVRRRLPGDAARARRGAGQREAAVILGQRAIRAAVPIMLP